MRKGWESGRGETGECGKGGRVGEGKHVNVERVGEWERGNGNIVSIPEMAVLTVFTPIFSKNCPTSYTSRVHTLSDF